MISLLQTLLLTDQLHTYRKNSFCFVLLRFLTSTHWSPFPWVLFLECIAILLCDLPLQQSVWHQLVVTKSCCNPFHFSSKKDYFYPTKLGVSCQLSWIAIGTAQSNGSCSPAYLTTLLHWTPHGALCTKLVHFVLSEDKIHSACQIFFLDWLSCLFWCATRINCLPQRWLILASFQCKELALILLHLLGEHSWPSKMRFKHIFCGLESLCVVLIVFVLFLFHAQKCLQCTKDNKNGVLMFSIVQRVLLNCLQAWLDCLFSCWN